MLVLAGIVTHAHENKKKNLLFSDETIIETSFSISSLLNFTESDLQQH